MRGGCCLLEQQRHVPLVKFTYACHESTLVKRLNASERRFSVDQQHSRTRSELRRAGIAKAQRLRAKVVASRDRRAGNPPRRRAERITAPRIFDEASKDYRQQLLDFLARLRQAFRKRGQSAVVIDFTHTTRFVSTATLLFFAELWRLIEMSSGNLRVRCKPPENDKASEVLRQIGVYELCKQAPPARQYEVDYDDVIHWRWAHGQLVDNSLCAPAVEAFEGQLAPPLVDGIFRGLGEAMTNAKQHAYIEIRPDGLNYAPPRQDWWMFSQAKDGVLSVTFCDLGVGIPITLPTKKPSLFARILSMGKADSDSACIEEAVEASRSRTNLPERGHGLGNIVNVVAQAPGGKVAIASNRGLYWYSDGKVTKRDYPSSLMGTLIYWSIPLGSDS